MIKMYWAIIGTLAVWRITHLLYAEDGPWGLLARLRQQAGTGFWAELLDCFYCLSLWVAILPALMFGESWVERVILWPALSGGAILVERITMRKHHPPPAIYYEEEEGSYGMLRTTQETNLKRNPNHGDTSVPPGIGGAPQ